MKDRLRHLLLENIANERRWVVSANGCQEHLVYAKTFNPTHPAPCHAPLNMNTRHSTLTTHTHPTQLNSPHTTHSGQLIERMLMRNTLSMLAELGVDGPNVYEEDFEQVYVGWWWVVVIGGGMLRSVVLHQHTHTTFTHGTSHHITSPHLISRTNQTAFSRDDA